MYDRGHPTVGTLSPAEKPKCRWIRIPFLGSISYKLANMLPEGTKAAFYSVGSLKNEPSKVKDRTEPLDQSGVYLFECGTVGCHLLYIGQSGRRLRQRAAEHERCFRLGKSTSANHLIESGHTSSFTAKLLHRQNKGRKLDALEISLNPNLTNDLTYHDPSPLLSLPSKLVNFV